VVLVWAFGKVDAKVVVGGLMRVRAAIDTACVHGLRMPCYSSIIGRGRDAAPTTRR